MGRHRGPKFSFPIPGRKSHPKVDKTVKSTDDLTSDPSLSFIPPVPAWPSRYEEPSNVSKAQRVLGTAPPPFRPSSRQASVPPSPGYMTITVSEPGSDFEDKASSFAMEDGSYMHPRRPNMSNRASSNILPTSPAYNGDSRRGSNCSSVSRQLHPRTSNSTMRSHYDAQTSPLSISQQTSDSAVRDMALRKGKPSIGTYSPDYHVPSPLGREVSQDGSRDSRRSKPPRLDLSKLFPKPNGQKEHENATPLLSPTKLVNSPTAMSVVSDYFPRPMTREPTPTLNGHAKLTKPKRHQASSTQPVRSKSPARLYKRDTYDSAKINVRRPPRGIQHWFEGLDEDSDDMEGDEPTVVHAPKPVKPSGPYMTPVRKSSLGRLLQDPAPQMQQPSRASQYIPDPRKPHNLYANQSAAHRLNSPSQFSVLSQSSHATTKTKESAFSKSNLQNASVLSFSSSEDEDEVVQPVKKKVPVRDSINITEDPGDVVIGQAQAFEVRPQNSRRPSVGKLSLLSTSTNAATIEVMYSPEQPFHAQHFPKHSTSSNSNSRRSSHLRQPSVIHELEDNRPKTALNRPQSSSSHSIRTSTSEPKPRADTQKFMAVTAEEEALLEALRKKRAAMAQQSWSEGYKSAVKQDEVRQQTPPERTKKDLRMSGFLSLESPSASPVRVVETKKKPIRKTTAPPPAPLLVLPSRGRPANLSLDSAAGSSILRDSSSCDPSSGRQTPPASQSTPSHQLIPPPEFSPLDPFPSPTPTASVASPTTTDHPSPLPSPVTPGLRHGEADVDVKVASSEPSWNGDSDEVAVLETGVIEPPAGSIKPGDSHNTHHQRRRTASSGTDAPISLPLKPSLNDMHELAPVSEASSRAPSVVEPIVPQPKLPRKSSRRGSSISVTTTGLPRSRQNSILSTRTTSPMHGHHERRSSRTPSHVSSASSSMKRSSVAMGSANTRSSVSEDVLAAWGSLGGLRDYNTARY